MPVRVGASIPLLMHYGLPADLDYDSDRLVDRFAAFAGAVAREVAALQAEVPADAAHRAPVYTLVNEISFLAWAAAETDLLARRRPPAARSAGASSLRSGFDVKCRLVRAVLAGIEAIREVDPQARFLHVEPVVHVVAPVDRPDLQALADQVAGYQWQTWDLIGGRIEPELGGTAAALDLIGVNHYHSGQWEVKTEKRLLWHERDPRRVPFSRLLQAAWQRYQRPLVVAETSHIGSGRSQWLDEMAAEVEGARRNGVPVDGLCLYPLVDRPDWNDAAHWHQSGLWDRGPSLASKRLNTGYAATVEAWQRRLPGLSNPLQTVLSSDPTGFADVNAADMDKEKQLNMHGGSLPSRAFRPGHGQRADVEQRTAAMATQAKEQAETQAGEAGQDAASDTMPHIDVNDAQAVQHWADRLDCSPQQIEAAVAAVGPVAADVEMHLKGSHSTTSADETQIGGA